MILSFKKPLSWFTRTNTSDDFGLYFLYLTIFFAPLSIFLAECFFTMHVVLFITKSRYRFIRLDLINISIFIVLATNLVSLIFNQSAHAFFDFKQSLYILIVPILRAVFWDEIKYIFLLRSFVYGMLVNAFFGIYEAFGFKLINTHGQGHLGLINFHIYSSMLICISILILFNDIFYNKVVVSPYLKMLFILVFLWQLFTTTGRTGQAILFILIPLILYWNIKIFRFLIFPTTITLVIASLIFLKKFRELWVAAYSQLHTLIVSGYSFSDIGLRFLFSKAGLIMFKSNPFFGVGIGQFRKNFYALINAHEIPNIPYSVHGFVGPTSSYVAYASELGVVGCVAISIFIYAIYKNISSTKCLFCNKIGILFLLWFLLGSFSDTIIWRYIIIVPFLFFVSSLPNDNRLLVADKG